MAWLDLLRENRAEPARPAAVRRGWNELLAWWSNLAATASGVGVSEHNAMKAIPVFACVRVIADTLASLPLNVYRRIGGSSKEPDRRHPLHALLHDAPNPLMTSFAFRECLTGHLLLWGNAYALIERRQGRIAALWPLRPDRVRVQQDGADLSYEYEHHGEAMLVAGRDDVLHIQGLGFDGVIGYSPIGVARQAVGMTLAAEEYGARFFGNNAAPGGVLTTDRRLNPDTVERIKESWNQAHQGPERAFRTAILEEGLSWQSIGMKPEEAQFIETRKFQTQEIARLYRVPPHMIGDLDRATFSNIEHQALEFVTHTMRPWLVRWEQELNRKLFRRPDTFAEFNVDGLLRGDIEARYRAYAVARQWGWLSANDIRDRENMNPIADGDVYLTPLNMIPAGTEQDDAAGA